MDPRGRNTHPHLEPKRRRSSERPIRACGFSACFCETAPGLGSAPTQEMRSFRFVLPGGIGVIQPVWSPAAPAPSGHKQIYRGTHLRLLFGENKILPSLWTPRPHWGFMNLRFSSLALRSGPSRLRPASTHPPAGDGQARRSFPPPPPAPEQPTRLSRPPQLSPARLPPQGPPRTRTFWRPPLAFR